MRVLKRLWNLAVWMVVAWVLAGLQIQADMPWLDKFVKVEDVSTEKQLKLVDDLMTFRLPPRKIEAGTSLNKVLDKIERQLAENGLELKFVRQPSVDDFKEPLSGVKIDDYCSLSGGVCAAVLEELCHAAGCAYCVQGDAVHIFKADTEKKTQYRALPLGVVTQFFFVTHGADKGARLKIKPAIAASRGRGRADMQYDEEREIISMTDNARNLYLVNQMLSEMYFSWLKLPAAAKVEAISVRTKKFRFDSQLALRQVVPTVFAPGCNLKDLLKYLSLHTKTGRIKTPVQFVSSVRDATDITFSQAFDFSYSSIQDALDMVCDACNGHYILKGGKVTIVPNQLETREYKVTGRGLQAMTFGRVPTSKDLQSRARKELVTDDNAQSMLKDLKIDFPRMGGVSYDKEEKRIKIETYQRAFRNMDCHLRHFKPIPEK